MTGKGRGRCRESRIKVGWSSGGEDEKTGHTISRNEVSKKEVERDKGRWVSGKWRKMRQGVTEMKRSVHT